VKPKRFATNTPIEYQVFILFIESIYLIWNQLNYYLQVVVERVPNSQIPEIDKRKFLVPNDISVAQFMWIIRKRIQLPSEKAIFLFVNKTIPQSSSTMGQIYTNFKDEDGFLYISYSGKKKHSSSIFLTTKKNIKLILKNFRRKYIWKCHAFS